MEIEYFNKKYKVKIPKFGQLWLVREDPEKANIDKISDYQFIAEPDADFPKNYVMLSHINSMLQFFTEKEFLEEII